MEENSIFFTYNGYKIILFSIKKGVVVYMNEKILIVDDDVLNLKVAEDVLKDKNYEVLMAETGMECLGILEKQTVDLILLDIEMPGMNGIQTLGEIHKEGMFPDIPVMLLSGTANADYIIKACRLGATGYIKKPLVPQDLLVQVEKAFSQ